jgi:hypothetical protein
MNGSDFYRIKTSWTRQMEDGSLSKVKTEELVCAGSYTEAEVVANALISKYERCKYSDEVSYEITKTKISTMLYNDNLVTDTELVQSLVHSFFEDSDETGVGMYAVKIMTITIDEKTAKERRSYETIYTPASSNNNAAEHVRKYLKGVDYVVRDIKFDKAEGILWSTEIHQSKTNNVA